MLTAIFLAVQAAAAPPADISLSATVEAREARVESGGQNSLTVHAEPDSGSTVKTTGGKNDRRWTLDASVRIADPGEEMTETAAPEPR